MAFDMHVKFTGGSVSIQGASNHSKHENQVPILSWTWGVSNTGNLQTGAGYASGGKANIKDITIVKYVDSCSNAILQACCTGARVDTATLYMTNATGDQTDFVTLELSQGVLITSVSTGGATNDERMTESVTLHFGEFKFSFQPQDTEGKASGGTKDFAFSMPKVKKD